MDPTQFRRLVLLRRQRGLTQQRLGALLPDFGARRALTQREISELERGWLNPRPDVLAALGRLFSVNSPETLLDVVEGGLR